jgi:hypothetical protein
MNKKQKKRIKYLFGEGLEYFRDELQPLLASGDVSIKCPDQTLLRIFLKRQRQLSDGKFPHLPRETVEAMDKVIAKTTFDYFWENLAPAFLAAMARLMEESFVRSQGNFREGVGLGSTMLEASASDLDALALQAEAMRREYSKPELRSSGRPPKGVSERVSDEQSFWQTFKKAVKAAESNPIKAHRTPTRKNVAENYGISERHLTDKCKKFAVAKNGRHFDNALKIAMEGIKSEDNSTSPEM